VSPKHLNEDSIAESAPIVTTHQNTAKTEVTESVAVNESGDMEHLRSQLSSLSSELSRERQRYESLESHCTSLQTELNDTKSELKRVLEVHAQELEASHLALTSFYAHVEDLQQQHEADRVRNNTMRLGSYHVFSIVFAVLVYSHKRMF
jgi:DNA repair exonuclease SbcCD ATPase subunit